MEAELQNQMMCGRKKDGSDLRRSCLSPSPAAVTWGEPSSSLGASLSCPVQVGKLMPSVGCGWGEGGIRS